MGATYISNGSEVFLGIHIIFIAEVKWIGLNIFSHISSGPTSNPHWIFVHWLVTKHMNAQREGDKAVFLTPSRLCVSWRYNENMVGDITYSQKGGYPTKPTNLDL